MKFKVGDFIYSRGLGLKAKILNIRCFSGQDCYIIKYSFELVAKNTTHYTRYIDDYFELDKCKINKKSNHPLTNIFK